MLASEGDDMNASFFEGTSVPLQEVMSLGSTLPFFAEKRLILIENTEKFSRDNLRCLCRKACRQKKPAI